METITFKRFPALAGPISRPVPYVPTPGKAIRKRKKAYLLVIKRNEKASGRRSSKRMRNSHWHCSQYFGASILLKPEEAYLVKRCGVPVHITVPASGKDT